MNQLKASCEPTYMGLKLLLWLVIQHMGKSCEPTYMGLKRLKIGSYRKKNMSCEPTYMGLKRTQIPLGNPHTGVASLPIWD